MLNDYAVRPEQYCPQCHGPMRFERRMFHTDLHWCRYKCVACGALLDVAAHMKVRVQEA